MTVTTTVITQEFEKNFSVGSEDNSDVASTHRDLIRGIAQQRFSILKRQNDEDWDQKQTSSIIWQEDQQATVPAEFRVTPITLFPHEPRKRIRDATFTPLQEWEGYVVELDEEFFTARLVDLTAEREHEEEEADFPIVELSDADQSMLRLGAIFRWAIGYRRTRGGTKERVSRIVFRRLPAWTERELNENRQKAQELAVVLQGE